MSLQVRRAAAGDGVKLRSILERLLIRGLPREGDAQTGFLMGNHTAATFELRIAQSPLVFVAELDGLPAGFLTAYPREVFAPMIEPKRAQNPAYAWILDHSPESAVLIDQIGVLPEFRAHGTAIALYTAFAAAAGRPVYLDIVHAPVMNRKSVAFFRDRLGFQLLTEVAAGPLTSGIYRKD